MTDLKKQTPVLCVYRPHSLIGKILFKEETDIFNPHKDKYVDPEKPPTTEVDVRFFIHGELESKVKFDLAEVVRGHVRAVEEQPVLVVDCEGNEIPAVLVMVIRPKLPHTGPVRARGLVILDDPSVKKDALDSLVKENVIQGIDYGQL
jgi:hypothetical protein